jgi:sporulation protein YqfC
MGRVEKKQKFKAKIADLLELPSDVLLDLPRLVLMGNQRLFLENHRGIIEYTNEVVRIDTPVGEVKATGKNLNLLLITKEEIMLEGELSKLEWVEREE